MQQTDDPTAALIASTSAESRTRGTPSREEDSFKTHTPARSAPSLGDTKSSALTYNSATTTVYARREVAAADVPPAPDNAALASTSYVIRFSSTTASTRSSGAEGPNPASAKAETVGQGSTANMAFGKTFSSTELKKGAAVDPDALSCPSPGLSPEAPATTAHPHDLVCRPTTVVVGTPDTSSGGTSPAGSSSPIIPAGNPSADSNSGVGGPTRVTASPRSGTAITTGNVATYVSARTTAGDTSQIHVAVNAQKKIQSTAPISSDGAAGAITNVANACNEETVATSSFSLTRDNPVMSKPAEAAEKRKTMNSPTTLTQAVTPLSENPQQRSTTCGAAQKSVASPLKQSQCSTVLALLDSTDSGAPLPSPSGARRRLSAFPTADLDLESFFPSLQSQSFAPSATTVELPDEQVADSSSRLADRILEAPSLKCRALSWHTSALPTDKCETTRSASHGDNSEACQEAPIVGGDPACRHTATGAGSAAAVENEVMPCARDSTSQHTFQSPLEPSVSAAGAQEKEEQSLRPMPTATAETPSTVTSSSSSGSAPASCSPASSSPSVVTAAFRHSGLIAASDRSPTAQDCCAKTRSSCPAPLCGDLFTRSAYKAPSATGVFATSSLRCSGISPVSLPPGAVSSLHYARLPPGSLVQRPDAVPTLKEGAAASGNVAAEANSEPAPAGTKRPSAPEPRLSSLEMFPSFVTKSTLSPTVETGTLVPRRSRLGTMSEDSQEPLTAAPRTEFAVSKKTHQPALGLEAPVPAISDTGAAGSEATDTGARHKDVEHRSTESSVDIQERGGTNGPHEQSSTTTSSTSCFAHRPPLSPTARSAAGGPHESALTHSLVADISRQIGTPFCNTGLKVGLPAAARGAVKDGAVRSEAPAAVGRTDVLLTVSPTDAGGDKRVHLPGNDVGAQPATTEAGSGSKDCSFSGSQRCVSRSFLAVGSSYETRGRTGLTGDDSNASTLRVRCLLAASLRSIFKMLIKRVRRRQHQHVKGGHSDATHTEAGEDVTGDDLREAKRRRIKESVCEAAKVPSASCVSDGKRPSPGTATSGAFLEMGIMRGSVGEKARAPVRGQNGSDGEHSSTGSPRRNWRPAENLHRRAASRMKAILSESVLTSLIETPRRGLQGRLQDLERQKAAWAVAGGTHQEKTAPGEAQQDAATVQSVSLFPVACSSSAHPRNSRAHAGLRQAVSERDAVATPRAERVEVGASSKRTLLETGPLAVDPLPPVLRKASLSTVPQASAAVPLVRGSQRDVVSAVDEDGNCRSPSCRTSRLEGRSCSSASRVQCSTEKPGNTLAGVPRTKMAQKLSSLDTSTLNKRCPSLPIFAAAGRPVRGLCYPGPCRLDMRGCCCSRGSKMASLQDAAALAEQQLLSAYRECFLLLTAAERKEELYIFEFVLLGGSCQNEAASPSERNSASALNNQRDGGDERQRQVSQLSHALLQAAEHGGENLHRDIAASVPSEDARLGKWSTGRGFAAEDVCAQKGQLGCAEDVFLGKPVNEDVGERGSARNAKPELLPACKQDAAEATRKRRRQIALQPEKWDAKKIHYVLAALDGLRDAWRQGSSNTRAKAQILESMFTPVPLGVQQRVLQLTQRQHVTASTHHGQPQKLLRQPPLEKYSDFQQVLALDTSTATQNADKPAACKNTLPSSSQDTETSEFSSTAGRSVLVPPVARPPTSVQSKLCFSACARDAGVRVRGSTSETDCGERCARACCCGNHQHCHHIATYCRRISCSSPHRSSSACCASHIRDRRGCEYRQKEASSCRADSGGQEECREALTTHRPCEPKGRRATTVVSSCGVRFPTTADTQPPEQRSVISHLESRCPQTAHQQHGHYKLRQSSAVTNDNSGTIVDSNGLPEEGRRCSLDCSGGRSLHQDALKRAKSAGTGCNGSADSLETSPPGRSRGECPAPARNIRDLRRGKLKSSPGGSFSVDGDKDVYKKPRPSVVSRRVLLQRQLQRQHRRSISHATATSDSDLDITSDTAPAIHHKKKCTIPAVTQPLETSVAGAAEMAEGRFAPSGKEHELPESRGHKLTSEAAAKRERGTAKVDEGDDFARQGVAGKCNRDNPAIESGSSQQTRLIKTFSSTVCHPDGVDLTSDRQREDTQAFPQNAKSTSGAAPSVVTGDSCTQAKSRSRSFLLSAPHLRTAQEFPKNASNKSSTSSAIHDDSGLGVKCQRALPSLTRTTPTSCAPALSLEVLQGESMVSGAQHSTNLSVDGPCRSDRRSEEGFTNQAAKEMPRAEGSASQDSQQHTAAMRTTRHNKTKQPGVFQFTRGPKRFWAASWYADGHPGWKAFSVEKWGNREAFERARRAYEEKVPRKCSGSCAAANNLPEVVVSSVRLPCRPVSPKAHTSLAHGALDRRAPGANNCTRSDIPNGDKSRISNGAGARPSNSTVSKAKKLTSLNIPTLSTDPRPFAECPVRLPVADASSTQQESPNLVDSHVFARDSLCWTTTRQDEGEKQGLGRIRRNSQKSRLTAEEKDGLSVVLSAQAACIGTETPYNLDNGKATLDGSSHRATSPSESVASAQSKVVWTQNAQDADRVNGHSSNMYPSERNAFFEAGTNLSLSYKGDPEQPKSLAEGDNLDMAHGGSLQEFWSSCSKGAGILPLEAAFTGKEVSPSVYGSSSSTGFELMAPTFSGSPRSLSQRQRPLGRQRQEQLRQGLEHLLLSSAPAVNEGEECSEAENERHRQAVERHVLSQTQQIHHSDSQGLSEAGLTSEAYALLSPTAFLPITPENEDVTAQLLLVSPEDEMMKAEGKNV